MDKLFGISLTNLIYSVLMANKGKDLTTTQIAESILELKGVKLVGVEYKQFITRIRDHVRVLANENSHVIKTPRLTDVKTTYYTYKILN